MSANNVGSCHVVKDGKNSTAELLDVIVNRGGERLNDPSEGVAHQTVPLRSFSRLHGRHTGGFPDTDKFNASHFLGLHMPCKLKTHVPSLGLGAAAAFHCNGTGIRAAHLCVCANSHQRILRGMLNLSLGLHLNLSLVLQALQFLLLLQQLLLHLLHLLLLHLLLLHLLLLHLLLLLRLRLWLWLRLRLHIRRGSLQSWSWLRICHVLHDRLLRLLLLAE
mmetsp:Transcript_43768/g.72750  ORF Transcript_43768/g.72750 Transcript_43768/m.72750 type:complete len:220 (-) Transcript_43768:211-870(-)